MSISTLTPYNFVSAPPLRAMSNKMGAVHKKVSGFIQI